MPGVSVEELLRLALPPGTVVAGGKAGLEQEVTWPTVLRSRPPAFEPFKGGEIALISLQTARLLDERLTLPRLMRSLHEAGVSAVAALGEIDEESRRLSEETALALLALPEGSNLHRIEQSISRTLIDRRSELYQRSQQIYQELTELVITGRGVPQIVERLGELSGRPVTLEDDSLALRVYATPGGQGPAREEVASALEQARGEVQAWLRVAPPSASDPPTKRFAMPSLGLVRVVAPVVSQDRIAGYLSIIGHNAELTEMERLAVARGAAACAIELVKEWAVLEAEDRLQVDLIDDLLNGEITSPDALQGRAKRLGFDLSLPYAVFVFQRQDATVVTRSRDVVRVRPGRAQPLGKVLERELANRGIAGLVGARDDLTTVLYPVPGGADVAALKNTAAELARAIARQSENDPSVGIGRLHPGMAGIRSAHREAQQAVAMGKRLFGPGKITFFGDLGLYRLVFGIKETSDLQEFYEDTLARLVAYDGKSDGELVKTLEAYFASHASPTEAARRLHLHRNTLLYRLRRIQEITGLDLEDAEVCLALHLALRVKDVLRAMPS